VATVANVDQGAHSRAQQDDKAVSHGVGPAFGIVLSAVLMTVRDQEPMVVLLDNDAASDVCRPDGGAATDRSTVGFRLPTGPLLPGEHDSLEHGLRALVGAQVGIDLGYTVQLLRRSCLG
jgi:hypothetical protein